MKEAGLLSDNGSPSGGEEAVAGGGADVEVRTVDGFQVNLF